MLNRSALFIDYSSPVSNSLIINVNHIEIRDDSVVIKDIDIDNLFLDRLDKVIINGYSFSRIRR